MAEKGARVVGVDVSQILLEKAEAEAAERGVDVEYVLGDMRSLPWRDRFDAAFLWYATISYFDDDERESSSRSRLFASKGRAPVNRARQSVRFATRQAPVCHVAQRDNDLRIDVMSNDDLVGRRICERIIVRNGCVRQAHLSFRQYVFSEYVRLLRNVGSETVEAYGEEGEAFKSDSPRIVVVAYK
ncbi:class I SAM-dependent methyltransferase [Mesorhizobium sp. M0254]|uniref:class I SAM-dependent methyltransferase n=1 Tax=Mesorhizobium sp. M0254 TaxID=2956927 RepID=UPI003339C3C0